MTLPLPSDDADLVVLARRGRDDAFAVLYERYFNGVFDFLTRLLRDRHEAADVAQDTFVKAFERLGHLKNPSAFKSWIFTIAHRNALNRIKRSRRAIAVGSFSDVDAEERATFAVIDVDQGGNPEHQVEIREAAQIVWEAAAGLDARTYAVMDLHVRHGLDSAEIAEVLGVTKGNAYTMVSRMKKSVSDTMATYLLVRKGRSQCEELATLVDNLGGPELTPELRRSVDRHARSCDVCTEQRKSLFVPLKLFAALVVVPAPAALKGSIWAAVTGIAAGTAGAGAAGAAVSGQAGGSGAAAASGAGAASGAATVGAAATAAGAGSAMSATWIVAAIIVALAATLGGIAVVTNATDGPAGDDQPIAGQAAPPDTSSSEPDSPAPTGDVDPTDAVVPGETTTTTVVPAVPREPETDPEPVAFSAADDIVTVIEDTAITVDVVANDTGAIPASVAIVSAPSHGDAAASDGSIRYAPEADFFGADSLEYSVAADDGRSARARVTFSVTGVNDAPRGNAERTFDVGEDGVVRFDPFAGIIDPDGDRLTMTRFDTETANGGRITEGSLIYRPAADWFGRDRFSYAVSDGSASLLITVRVSVAAVNDPPRGRDRTVRLAEDGEARIDLLKGWSDVEGDPIRLVGRATISADHGSVVVTGDEAVYTPDPDFSGADAIVYTVSDGAARSSGRVSLDVRPIPDAPVVGDLSIVVDEGTPAGSVIGRLEASDPDDDVLDFVVTGGNTSVLDVTAGGAIRVLQTIDHENGSGLQLHGFVEDPTGLRDRFLVKVVVNDVNEPPTVGDEVMSVQVGAPPNTVIGRVAASDPDGDDISFAIVGPDARRVLKIDVNSGEVRVARRALAQFFPVTVTVRVSDPDGLSADAQLTVVAVDDQGPALSDPIVDRLVVYEAADDGGRCSLGPNRSNIAVRVTDPSGVAEVVIEWSASFLDTPVTGVTNMRISGNRATGSFTFQSNVVDADGSSELVAWIVAADDLGNTSTSGPATLTILRCNDDPVIGGYVAPV